MTLYDLVEDVMIDHGLVCECGEYKLADAELCAACEAKVTRCDECNSILDCGICWKCDGLPWPDNRGMDDEVD